jgi:hypothetical protein
MKAIKKFLFIIFYFLISKIYADESLKSNFSQINNSLPFPNMKSSAETHSSSGNKNEERPINNSTNSQSIQEGANRPFNPRISQNEGKKIEENNATSLPRISNKPEESNKYRENNENNFKRDFKNNTEEQNKGTNEDNRYKETNNRAGGDDKNEENHSPKNKAEQDDRNKNEEDNKNDDKDKQHDNRNEDKKDDDKDNKNDNRNEDKKDDDKDNKHDNRNEDNKDDDKDKQHDNRNEDKKDDDKDNKNDNRNEDKKDDDKDKQHENKNEDNKDDDKDNKHDNKNEDNKDDDKDKQHDNKNKNEEDNKNDENNKHSSRENGKEEDKKDDEKKDQQNQSENRDEKKKSRPSTVILLGFDKFEKDEDEGEVSFNAYFVPVKYRITAKSVKIPLKLRYKQSLRGLEDEELVIECKKREKKGDRKVRFKCKFNIKGKKIDNIEVEEDKIDFIDQEVTIKSCSPLAVKYLKKLQTVGKQEKFRKKLFLLEYAALKKTENDFTIEGRIKDKSFDNDEVTLTVLNEKKKQWI